jgi:AmmeMemoRadiSam system protein A
VYEQFNFEPHRHREHAIETQVPFLQLALAGNFRIVAIAVTNFEMGFVKKVADALAEVFKGKKVLLVASTDLTHYPPYEKANEIDAQMMESWKTLDGAEIVEREAELVREHPIALRDGCAMCGRAAVAIVVEAAKLLDADSIELLKYANSGDTPRGSKDEVVGYGAAVVYEKIKLGELSRAGQRFLLKVAREAITTYIAEGKLPAFEANSEELKMKRAVFVTLMKHDKLRGCIGCFSSDEELPITVAKFAVCSGMEDTRFDPVREREMKDIKIEISILSEEFKKVKSVDEIVLGKHGIRVVDPRTGRSGTYLPGVPIDHNMTLETFLSKCCAEKLGVAADAWKKGKVDIYTYTTQKFGEK